MKWNEQDANFFEDDSFIDALMEDDRTAWNVFFKHFDKLISAIVGWKKWNFSFLDQRRLKGVIHENIRSDIVNYHRESSFEYFVKRIAVHQCIAEIRTRVNTRQVFIPISGEDTTERSYDDVVGQGAEFDPVMAVAVAERASALKRKLQKLNEKCRNTVKQFYFERMPYKEIARCDNVSCITTTARVERCLNGLRQILEKK